jgi:hypothetical protein
MDNIYISRSADKINKMYEGLTYFDQYGTTVFIFIILLIILFVIVSYTQVMRNVQPIKDDWINQKCKPQIIPFAGLINKPSDMTAADFTGQNFTNCMQNILTNITSYAVEPIKYMTYGLQNLFSGIIQDLQNMRNILSSVRSNMTSITQEIMGRVANIMVPLQQMIIAISDTMNKVKGVLTAGLYTCLGAYYSLTSLFQAIMQGIITILIILAVLIIALWIIPFTMPMAATLTAVFISISIPLAIVLAFMSETLHINADYSIPSPPPRPSCFDKNTLIKMLDNTYKKIEDIIPGDILEHNALVTATFKLDSQSETQKMFSLNGITVSETHPVFDKINKKWIPVSSHPCATPIHNYSEPYLYCLTTNLKRIQINSELFLDWDETPNIIETDDLHMKSLGLNKQTKIKLNSKIKKIKDIEIGDIVENNNKIIGIVKIKNNLGDGELYQLITEKKYFYIYDEGNESKMYYNDYDYNIERFLEQQNIIF